MSRVGIYHSMEQFFKKALQLQHPMGTHNAVSDGVKEIIFNVFSKGFNEVAKSRIQAISKVTKMRKELEVEEMRTCRLMSIKSLATNLCCCGVSCLKRGASRMLACLISRRKWH